MCKIGSTFGVGNAGWEDLFKSVLILEICEKFVKIKFLMPVDEQLRLPSSDVEDHLESCKGICRSNLKHLIEVVSCATLLIYVATKNVLEK